MRVRVPLHEFDRCCDRLQTYCLLGEYSTRNKQGLVVIEGAIDCAENEAKVNSSNKLEWRPGKCSVQTIAELLQFGPAIEWEAET
jgi:hypothetical protein